MQYSQLNDGKVVWGYCEQEILTTGCLPGPGSKLVEHRRLRIVLLLIISENRCSRRGHFHLVFIQKVHSLGIENFRTSNFIVIFKILEHKYPSRKF